MPDTDDTTAVDADLVTVTQMLEAFRFAYLEAMKALSVVTRERDAARRANDHLRDELRRYTAVAVLGRAA